MIQLITEPWYGDFSNTLIAMHQLRYRVFRVRMDWDVQTCGWRIRNFGINRRCGAVLRRLAGMIIFNSCAICSSWRSICS